MKQLIYYFLLLTTISLQAQTYVPLADLTGFDRSRYQADLDSVAQDLATIFEFTPEIQSQFKVFDFGFYLHQTKVKDGIPEAFALAQQLAARQAPYYLLFAKQSDEMGLYSKFLVDLKLPEVADGFACLTADKRELLQKITNQAVNEAHTANNKNPFLYANSEMTAMLALKEELERSIFCCQASSNARSSSTCECKSPAQMADDLALMGYLPIENSTVTIERGATYEPSLLQSNIKITVSNNGYDWEMTDELATLLTGMNGTGSAIVYHLNDTTCHDFDLLTNGETTALQSPVFQRSRARNSGNNSFFEEIVVLDFGEQPQMFFKFSEEGKSNEVINWSLKNMAVEARGGLIYAMIALRIEKCFLGVESFKKIWLESKAYSSSWEYTKRSLEAANPNKDVYGNDLAIAEELSNYIFYRGEEENLIDGMMAVAVDVGINNEIENSIGIYKSIYYDIQNFYPEQEHGDNVIQQINDCLNIGSHIIFELIPEEIEEDRLPALINRTTARNGNDYVYITPSGKIACIENIEHATARFDRTTGALLSFQTMDGIQFKPFLYYANGNQFFRGYINELEYETFWSRRASLGEKRTALHGDLINANFYADITPAKQSTSVYARCYQVLINEQINRECYIEYIWDNFKTPYTEIGGNRILSPLIPVRADIYLIENYLISDNCIDQNEITPGFGFNLYDELKDKIDEDKVPDLIYLANTISSRAAEKTAGFYGYLLEHTNYTSHSIPDSIVNNYFFKNGIINLEEFDQAFPYISFSREQEVIFSIVDLREEIPEGYNAKTENYVLTGQQPYEYSLNDLKVRYELKNGGYPEYWTHIDELESTGLASPIHRLDFNAQYNSRFGTNSAMFSWMSHFTHNIADVYEFGVMHNVARYTSKIFTAGSKATKKGWVSKAKSALGKLMDKLAIKQLIDDIKVPELKNLANTIKNSNIDAQITKKLTDDVLQIKVPRQDVNGNPDWVTIAEIKKTDEGSNVLIIQNDELIDDGIQVIDEIPVGGSGKIKNSDGDLLEEVEMVTKEDGSVAFRAFNLSRFEVFANKFNEEVGGYLRGLSTKDKFQILKDYESNLNVSTINAFNNEPRLVDWWKKLWDKNNSLRLNYTILEKIDFLKVKGLTDDQIFIISQFNDPKAVDLCETMAKRNDFDQIYFKIDNGRAFYISDNLHNVAVYAKEAEANFPNVPNVMDDFINFVGNPKFRNPEHFDDWLKGARGNNDPTYTLELEDAKRIMANGDEVKLGYQPGINTHGTIIDVDVYNVSKNIAIESKQIDNYKNFNKRLGAIGEKFNSESKLPSSIRNSFSKLEGSIHVIDEQTFRDWPNPGGFSDEDLILHHIQNYVGKSNPNAELQAKIDGVNRLSRLRVRIGNNLEFVYSREEW